MRPPAPAPVHQRTARVLLLLMLLLPAAFTLGEAPTAETDLFARVLRGVLTRLTPLPAGQLSEPRVEWVANAVLFLPLGLVLPVALPRVPLTVLLLAAALLSLAIELAQHLVLADRTPDVVDIVANTSGAALGLVLGADLVRALVQRRARAG